jgi:DNA-3-methyladenine glycosylase
VDDEGRRLSGRIVEVEAYLGGEDKAAHSYLDRRTPKNASMFLDAGAPGPLAALIEGTDSCMTARV